MELCRKMSFEEFFEGYVDAYYPGITGYAYQAEMLSVEEGRDVMQNIVKKVDHIETCLHSHPTLHMKDGTVLEVTNSDEFPQPSTEE